MKKNHLLLSCVALSSLLAVSCTNDEPIEVNPDPVGNAITFSPSVGRASRAVETKIDNLGNFGVWARSLDNNGKLYDYIIGSDNAPVIATRKSLADDKSEGYWYLPYNVYWPNGVNRVLFWSLTLLQDGNKGNGDVLDGNGTLSFVGSGPRITGFSPLRAENRTEAYMDGANQQDLVGAFTPQNASESKTNVTLNFTHKLAQINIEAKAGQGLPDNNARRVMIKGAWIVNAHSTGQFDANYDYIDNAPVDKPEWTTNDSKQVAYGTLFSEPLILDKNSTQNKAVDILKGITTTGTSSLMLIPQTVEQWDKNGAGTQEDDERGSFDTYTTNQAYILLFCRIESVHNGGAHDGSNDGIGVSDDKSKHYHQLFPRPKKVDDVEQYNATEYGYTCVPVPIAWEQGKKYTYVLDICGANSGGGVYPPKGPEDVPPGVEPPGDKKPGDNVLDDPISFTVKVTGWESGNWESGNGNFGL